METIFARETTIRPLAASDLDRVVALDASIEGRSRREYYARRLDVAALIVRQGTGAAIVGLGAGLLGASWAASLARHQLFGVDAAHPGAYILAACMLIAAAIAASLAPAIAAARLDPVVALSNDQ